jgi:hypothetical protein
MHQWICPCIILYLEWVSVSASLMDEISRGYSLGWLPAKRALVVVLTLWVGS